MGDLMSRQDLAERGWTGGMIRRHLGTPVRYQSQLGEVDRWLPQVVRAAEARPDVRAELRDALSRRLAMVTARREDVAAMSYSALQDAAARVWKLTWTVGDECRGDCQDLDGWIHYPNLCTCDDDCECRLDSPPEDLEPSPMPADLPDEYRQHRLSHLDGRIAQMRTRMAELVKAG